MGWGTSWGTSWGGGSGGGVFAVASAMASASNAVRVTFTRAPLYRSPVSPGDASRLTNWTLTRTDAAQKLTIIASRGVVGDPLSVEFIIAQRWAAALAEYTIEASPQLKAADGVLEIVSPFAADFLGSPPPAVQLGKLSNEMVDVANPESDGENGHLITQASGDYANEQGIALLKKIISRSVFWAQGEARHLDNTVFGEGVEEKELRRPVDLITMQARLEAVVARQPEVIVSQVRVVQYSNGQQDLFIRAQTSFGPLEDQFPLTPPGG